jgi:hypothetical protein
VLQDRLKLLHGDLQEQVAKYVQLLEHTDDKTRKLIEQAQARLQTRLPAVTSEDVGAELT